MSYYASINKSSFFVSTENTGKVLAKFQKTPYRFNLDDDGNIISIDMNGYLLGNDLTVFQAVAPYVRNNSFILVHGACDESWKWVFENGTCKEVKPRTVWG